MTSVTCNNVRMVTMEGCVDVVGVAGRYLGLEEPVKLIRGWVFLAVSFPRAHSRRSCVGRRVQKPAHLKRGKARGESSARIPGRAVVYCPGAVAGGGEIFSHLDYPDLAHFSACTEISLHSSR